MSFLRYLIFLVFSAQLCQLSAADLAPTIVSLSNSQRATEGENLSLSVSVNGTAPFTYVWKKGGVVVSGATTNTLTFSPLRVSDAGGYTVTITNTGGSLTSAEILLDVMTATAPRFYYQPSNATYTVGETINLYASASGTYPITYTWKKGMS